MNRQNSAIKRIKADLQEVRRHPSPRYHAVPLDDNLFEWHFTIRGPPDTAFAGGVFHGRILLPAEYPFKPPNIVFMTKNGRFEVGTKICLSISSYHEETWQPAWGIRTMLEAIISFLPSEGAGAIGALDWTAEERKKLAIESQTYCCPQCGHAASMLAAEGSIVESASASAPATPVDCKLFSNSTDSTPTVGGGNGVDRSGSALMTPPASPAASSTSATSTPFATQPSTAAAPSPAVKEAAPAPAPATPTPSPVVPAVKADVAPPSPAAAPSAPAPAPAPAPPAPAPAPAAAPANLRPAVPNPAIPALNALARRGRPVQRRVVNPAPVNSFVDEVIDLSIALLSVVFTALVAKVVCRNVTLLPGGLWGGV